MDFSVDLKLPRGVRIKGGIPSSQDPAELVSDMVEIDLPDGNTLDVGWVPEHDPAGRYRLKVYRDYWSETVEGPFFYRSREAIIAAIRLLVLQSSAPQTVACSGNIEVRMPRTPVKRRAGYFPVGAGS